MSQFERVKQIFFVHRARDAGQSLRSGGEV